MTTEDDTVTGTVVPTTREQVLADPYSGVHPLQLSEQESQLIYSGKDGTDLEEADPYRRILDQILNAETPDAVLTPVEAHKIGEYLGIPLLLFGFELQRSEYDTGSPFYAAMQCRDVNKDEPVVITSGHRKVLAQLVKLRQFAQWPYQVMPIARGTGQGGDPLYELTKWPEGYTGPAQDTITPF